MIEKHINCIGKLLNDLYKRYENIILKGDFNSEMGEDAMQEFCSSYNLNNLVNKPTCFKNIGHPCCIDLILTNKSRCFQNTSVIGTGVSDFHRLKVTIVKTSFQKLVPKIINCRTYKHFDNEEFRKDFPSKHNFHNRHRMHKFWKFIHAPLEKGILELIMLLLWTRLFAKLLWSDLNHEINFWNPNLVKSENILTFASSILRKLNNFSGMPQTGLRHDALPYLGKKRI